MLTAGSLLLPRDAARAVDFIRGRRRPDRLWEYDPALGIPPDVDSTACALAALARHGSAADLDDGADLLRAFWRGDTGPFRTWRAPGMWSLPERDDPVVNGNVLLALRLLGTPATAQEQNAALALCARTQGRSRYYCSPAAVAHAACRAGLPKGSLPGAATEQPAAEDLLGAVLWLAATGIAAPGLTGAVLAAQRPDGAWPIRPWVTGEGVPFWASAAVTTAVALEALARLEQGRAAAPFPPGVATPRIPQRGQGGADRATLRGDVSLRR
jgi:hypothetical protein